MNWTQPEVSMVNGQTNKLFCSLKKGTHYATRNGRIRAHGRLHGTKVDTQRTYYYRLRTPRRQNSGTFERGINYRRRFLAGGPAQQVVQTSSHLVDGASRLGGCDAGDH